METIFGTIMALVCVQVSDGGIGLGLDLIWKGLKGDMKGFVARTKGQVVILGRKTLESFEFKPLPNRINIVITRSPEKFKHLKEEHGENIHFVTSPLAALQLARKNWPTLNICVIGGAEIYNELFKYCNKLFATEVHGNKEANVFLERPIYFDRIGNPERGPDESVEYYFVEYNNPYPVVIPEAA